MRSVVKSHEDTREEMFLWKPAGQLKMHHSVMIYDFMASQEEECTNVCIVKIPEKI